MKTWNNPKIWLAGLVACSFLTTGCVGVLPMPASRTKVEHGTRITPEQTAFIEAGKTTRAEVIEKLGSQFVRLPYHRAIAYTWEMKGGGYIYWWSVLAPYPLWNYPYDVASDVDTVAGGWRAFFVAFDDQGVVQATTYRSPSTGRSMHEHLSRWASKLPAANSQTTAGIQRH